MKLIGQHKLNRRAVLRGAGTVAIALPWLEIMGTHKEARAATGPAKRFLSVYTPGGTVADKFWPTGTPTAPVYGQILAPLQSHLQDLLVVKGLSMTAIHKKLMGEQHQAGICGLLTGLPQPGVAKYPKGPSIDQVIATQIQTALKPKKPGDPDRSYPRKSLQLAVRWATGKSHGLLHPINSANFDDQGSNPPIAPQLDPADVFSTLFRAAQSPAATARSKSILDHVIGDYTKLQSRVSASDRAKLDQHLTKIRELEMALGRGGLTGPACKPPTLIDTTGYNATTGLNSENDGSIRDQATDAMIPAVGKFMMDMMVMAFACDLTAVGSFQWSDTEAKHTFPWLNLTEHHHFYQHDGTFRPIECAAINTWYSEMHAYLLTAMKNVTVAGGGTLLDESVVFFGSELAHPPTHEKTDMPLLLAGGGGGLKGGRMLSFKNQPHNNLLVSILNLFGDSRATFGDPELCQDPLTGLTT